VCAAVKASSALALQNVPFHFFFVDQVESDCAVNLLQAQCRLMRSNGFWRFTLLKLVHNVSKGYTASDQVEAFITSVEKFPAHSLACFKSTRIQLRPKPQSLVLNAHTPARVYV
jgi:hypothetical protein